MLRYRHKLVKMRTIIKNSLQALALQSGLARGTKLLTKAGKQELRTALLSAVMKQQYEQWLELLEAATQSELSDCWNERAPKFSTVLSKGQCC